MRRISSASSPRQQPKSVYRKFSMVQAAFFITSPSQVLRVRPALTCQKSARILERLKARPICPSPSDSASKPRKMRPSLARLAMPLLSALRLFKPLRKPKARKKSLRRFNHWPKRFSNRNKILQFVCHVSVFVILRFPHSKQMLKPI